MDIYQSVMLLGFNFIRSVCLNTVRPFARSIESLTLISDFISIDTFRRIVC
jgi:hypothetical protein